MTALPPAVLIHGFADGRAVLSRGRPVTLVSAPGAALYAGPGWWAALCAALREQHPGFGFVDVLDCADAAGLAAKALRIGLPRIAFSSPLPGVSARVAAIAAAAGAAVLPAPPPALDMARTDARRALTAWLGEGPAG